MGRIYKIEAENLDDRKKLSNEYTIDLGISSIKTALLLNKLIDYRLANCEMKVARWYAKNERKGGGLLVKADPRIIIDEFDKIYIYFSNDYAVSKYVRVASSKDEIRKSVLDKFANELKKMWERTKINDTLIIPVTAYSELSTSTWSDKKYLDVPDELTFDDPTNGINGKMIKISFNEYRALYEYLKSREKASIIKRDTQEAYDSMIGKQIEDQFLLTAMETIQNEIKNAINEFETAKKTFEKEKEDAWVKFVKERNEKIENAKTFMENRVNELKAQMEDMKKMAAMATNI